METHVCDGIKYTYPVGPGPCAECGIDEPCMEWNGRMLCYEHWHGEREKTQCYRAVRVSNGWGPDSVRTKEEAEEIAKEHARKEGCEWHAVPVPTWTGNRLAHPGYNYKRYKLVRAYMDAFNRRDMKKASELHRLIYPEVYAADPNYDPHKL